MLHQAELVAKVLKSVVSMATAALCTLLSASAGADLVCLELLGKTERLWIPGVLYRFQKKELVKTWHERTFVVHSLG